MIFISYAAEDRDYAHALYTGLSAHSLDPWMDKPPAPNKWNGISVGSRWESVLIQQIESADYIAIILSPNSVQKKGYVQKEFRLALERMNLLPDDDILVLPLMAKKCDVPNLRGGSIQLRDLQWVEVQESEIPEFCENLADQLGGLI